MSKPNLYISPVGMIPAEQFEAVLKKTNITFTGTQYPPTVLDFSIRMDTPEQREKYSELIGATRAKTGSTTCLKNYVESLVLARYQNKYGTDTGTLKYLRAEDSLLYRSVVESLLAKNESTQIARDAKNTKNINTKKKERIW